MSEPTPERRCEWCGQPLSPRQKATDSASHRAARWRWLHGIGSSAGEPPAAPPWPESPLHGRMGELAANGLKVPYQCIVDRLTAEFETLRVPTPRLRAEHLVRCCLTPHQRALLEARDQ